MDERVGDAGRGEAEGDTTGEGGLGGMEAAVRAGTTPSSAAGDVDDAPGGQAGEDPLEARAAELGDVASMQADPGEGVVDSAPGQATEKHASTGASMGTGPLGLGTLDEGATSQLTGTGEPAAADEELPER